MSFRQISSLRRRSTCCDYCEHGQLHSGPCPHLPARCRLDARGSCHGCPPCEHFRARAGFPFRNGVEILEAIL
jgi:hypothetical protein